MVLQCILVFSNEAFKLFPIFDIGVNLTKQMEAEMKSSFAIELF